MRSVLLAAALIVAPAAALADGLSYTYADLRYFVTDGDDLSVNQQGGALSGSFAIDSTFFVAGDASFGYSDGFNGGHFKTITTSLRGGAHYPVTDAMDVVGTAGALFADVSGNGADDNDIGYRTEAGLRLALTPQVEVGAFYSYQSIFSNDTSAFNGELQYHITESISAIASATNGRNADLYTVGARYRFE